ncbi:hypothetical protein [Jannaschia sp. W003]|uniref:hypothetical protein n=1 Tax=Jannaschia sp. W003 TaxID=2867012 RepID=UPI0021A769EB|nr:hypothetical protein [Jannaschia sp. W003]UWQ22855.1 hypothetical protein K3554_07480 [Jannaschia sp. W003]
MRSTPIQVSATSPVHLISLLNEISPDTHGDRRFRKASREFWIIAKAISKVRNLLPDSSLLLQHSDRPDFWLQSDNASIAIEVTSLIPEIYAQALEILGDTDQPYSVNGLFMAGDYLGKSLHPKKRDRREEVKELVARALDFKDRPSYGNDWEERITRMVEARVQEKLTRAHNYPDITNATERWLVIYDRASPAGTNLKRAVADYQARNRSCTLFDTVLFLTNGELFRLH